MTYEYPVSSQDKLLLKPTSSQLVYFDIISPRSGVDGCKGADWTGTNDDDFLLSYRHCRCLDSARHGKEKKKKKAQDVATYGLTACIDHVESYYIIFLVSLGVMGDGVICFPRASVSRQKASRRELRFLGIH